MLESESHINDLSDVGPYVIGLYRNGKSTVEIGKMFGFSSEGIRKFLQKRKIKLRKQAQTSALHTVDHDYFTFINTLNKAFWLGYVLTHGIIIKRGNNSWPIMIMDFNLNRLNKFKAAIISSKPIYKQKNRNRYVLTINSTVWAKALFELGWYEFKAGNKTGLLSKIDSKFHTALHSGVCSN